MQKKILTVTLNPAIDKMAVVPRLNKGAQMRAGRMVLSAGGKGVNVARALTRLGCPVLATGILAGVSGEWLRVQLEKEDIPGKFSFAEDGETRMNLTLVSPQGQMLLRILESGPQMGRRLIRDFERLFIKLLPQTKVLVLSGGLPWGTSDDLYARLICLANRRGILTVLDSSGAILRKALFCRPFLVKPNREEAEEAFGRRLDTLKEVYQGAQSFLRAGAQNVIISLGKDGAVAANPQGIWRARGDSLGAVRHTVGCGDAMIAGFLYGFNQGLAFSECFRFSVAAGIINAGQTKPGEVSKFCLKKMVKKVSILKIF